MSGTARLEKIGVPTVFIPAEGFDGDAKNASKVWGIPAIRMVVAKGYRWMGQTDEEKLPVAKANIDAIIDALTRPLTEEEKNPPPILPEEYPPVVITAKSYEAAVEDVNQMFIDNKWGDGLALIPPTREAVDWMLTGTSRSPDEEIGRVAPNWGMATIENIAINAVMAGAKPEYLPVIIAAIEGITGPDYKALHPATSAGCFSVTIVVSGPIGYEIGMLYNIGILGYGSRASNSIGRTVKLCIINLGHNWPGQGDLCQRGRDNPITGYCFSERPDSPWEPYHVAAGLGPPGSSAVTVQTTAFGGTKNYGGIGMSYQGGRGLERIIEDINKNSRACLSGGIYSETQHPGYELNSWAIVFNPDMAIGLKEAGFDQVSLQNYLYDITSVPYEELTPEDIAGIEKRIELTELDARTYFHMYKIPKEYLSRWKEGLKPGGKVPILGEPADLRFFVSGTTPGTSLGWMYPRGFHHPATSATVLIHGATLTEAGR